MGGPSGGANSGMPRTKWWPARKSPPPPLRFAPDKREEAANGPPDRYRLSTSQAPTRWRSCGACPGPPDPRRRMCICALSFYDDPVSLQRPTATTTFCDCDLQRPTTTTSAFDIAGELHRSTSLRLCKGNPLPPPCFPGRVGPGRKLLGGTGDQARANQARETMLAYSKHCLGK